MTLVRNSLTVTFASLLFLGIVVHICRMKTVRLVLLYVNTVILDVESNANAICFWLVGVITILLLFVGVHNLLCSSLCVNAYNIRAFLVANIVDIVNGLLYWKTNRVVITLLWLIKAADIIRAILVLDESTNNSYSCFERL